MENELGRIVDALPGLVWTAYPDGRIEFVNRRWCEYTGLSVDLASGEGWQKAFHPEDRPALVECWRASVAAGESAEMEARMRRFDGAYRWFLCRASPIANTAGEVVKWCGINSDIEDRKQAEVALRVHEQRFELIVNSLPTRVVLFSPEGEVLHANRHTLDYAGATLDELKAWKTNGLTHPDDREATIARFHASIGTGEPYDAESRHRRADGVYRWFRVQGIPLRDNEGRIALWYFLQTDIDDRKQTEALLAAERRLLEMVALGQPLSTVIDELCQLVEVVANGCFCRISVSDGDDATVQQIESPGPHFFWETPILSRTGEVLGTCTLVGRQSGGPTAFQRDWIGQFMHIASIAIERARSIAARQLADERLQKSAALMSKVERLSSSGSFCWRPATGSITFSEQLYRIFGIEPGTPITKAKIAARYHPCDVHLLGELFERAHEGRDHLELEHRLLLPDGSVRCVHLQAHATRDPQGQQDYIGAVQDTTERRKSDNALLSLRAELAHLSRVNSLGALTASIAHEISQPLAGITANASICLRMLSAAPPSVEGALDTLRRTIRDAHRASEVITRLRALFIRKVLTTAAVDLVEATQEVIELLRGEIRNKRIVLRLDAADDLPLVTVDKVQIQQVVLNLLLNAVEAMNGVDDRPRRMLVGIGRDNDDGVRLAVTDSGVGLDPKHAGKLFDPFFTTKREGMGVGLFVSRCIVECHGGRLWASSNAGHGATFAFAIPSLNDTAPPKADPGGASGPMIRRDPCEWSSK
jgi:PAS domain S-box-containing protein